MPTFRAPHWLLGVGVMLAACGSKAPSTPSTVTPTAPLVLSATPAAPATGALIPFASQPLSLLVTIDPAASAAGATTKVEVARDAGFTDIVQEAPVSTIASSATVTLMSLPGGATYYWRTRSLRGAENVSSPGLSFTLGPSASLAKPVLVNAENRVVYLHPLLLASFVPPAGGASTFKYRFELALTPTFLPVASSSPLLAVGSFSGTTQNVNWTVVDELQPGTTYYWRVQPIDQSTNASVYSDAGMLTTMPSTIDGQASLHLTRTCTYPDGKVVPTEYAFDGQASITDSHVRFQRPGNSPYELRLDADFNGTSMSGDVFGSAFPRMGGSTYVQVWSGPSVTSYQAKIPASVSGRVDNADMMSGSLQGMMGFWCGSDCGTCSGQTVQTNTWKLFLR